MTEDASPSAGALERDLARIGRTLALGQLAPGVIHEINNPLFAILGLLEFLLADAEPGSKDRERLLLVQQSGLEIRDIVRALMDFSREAPDEQAELGLGGLAGEAIQLFQRTSASRDIELEVTSGPGPLVVSASSNALKVALVNVLTNAQHAMPHGGTVRIAVTRAGEAVLATVTDSGTGVAADIAASIFEPFFTTRAAQGAAGLGLTIARALVREHRGDLRYEPSGEPGARFVLQLPAAGT